MKFRLILFALLAIVAFILSNCERYPILPPPLQLTSRSGEPAGPNCPQGGIRVDYGADTNRDSLLNASEIQSTKFICNGAGSPFLKDTLVNTVDLPSSIYCPGTGIRLDIGYDLNEDGLLESGEVRITNYDCDPSNTRNQVKFLFLDRRAVTTTSKSGPPIESSKIRIDMTDYLGYGAAFLRGFLGTTDVLVDATIDLYNLTDDTVIQGSEALFSGPVPGWAESENFLVQLPNKPVDIVLRVRSSKEGVKIGAYQAYLIIYRPPT